MILFLSINVISANEINENNLDSIILDSSNNAIDLDSVEIDSSSDSNVKNNNILSKDSTEINAEDSVNINNNNKKISNNLKSSQIENDGSDDSNSLGNANLIKTNITVQNTSILRGTDLYVFLKDSKGHPIANKTVTLTFNNRQYNKITNSNGRVGLRISSAKADKYNLIAAFGGDSNYAPITKSFTLDVYQIETYITINSKTIVRGQYLNAHLKNSSGELIAGQNITITFRGSTYKKTTNSNGKVSLRINSAPAGQYEVKINYAGSTQYMPSNRSFTLNVVRQNTSISVTNTSILRGNYLYVYLKNSTGEPIESQNVTIRFNNKKDYIRTTDIDGKAALRISAGPGSFPIAVSYGGSGYCLPCTHSFTVKSYLETPVISISNSSVVRNKTFYAYLKDSSKKPISDQKIIITFSDKNYTRTTDSNGRVGLHITAPPKSYSVKITFEGSTSYKAVNKSLTLKVLTNATAKIIAASQSSLGEYSIRLTDMNGKALANQNLTIIVRGNNQSSGSGKKIAQKTIVIDSDNIFNPTKDKQYMEDLATALRAKGYNVIVSGIGPNTHCVDVMGQYSDSVILCLLGGVDSGCFVDMSAKYYQNYLKTYNNRVVLGFLVPPNYVDLATCEWLKRAHDDNYSPANFTGLEYPGTYLNQHGMDYIYGRNVTEMANNFVKYAVNGLSIGLNNTLPHFEKTYTLKTNSKGYATITDLSSGVYNIQISYSNTKLGYIADTVKKQIEIL